ncbi:phage tail tape measure protein [Dietzia sp. NCCP-2495]|uniref:phage tail tape measure protein n=1 Tax=Dietzia sp. NCCP-2495 TaxID=2934675 RepID=UPI002230B886|nr:phage tail tape measure protein [Dietzia sp. NCCP-2495]
MASDDAVWVPVLPSLKDFGKNLASGTKGAGAKVGEQVGKEIADGISKSEAAVTKASSAAEKAHNRVADAAGKVRVAQEQYNKALESGDPVKIARAEEQLESQRRRQAEATTAAEQADKNLTGAQERLAQAHKDSEQAAREQSRAVGESKLSAEQAEQATKDLESAQKILEVGLVAVGAAAIATAGYLVSLGSDFHSMSRDIRVGTGASGEALAGLEASALSVMRTVPNAMGEVGSTLADLNTRLGLTGTDLETVSRQMLELENITGIAPNINDISAAMTGFGISGADTSGALDTLFRVSQATGVGVDSLASSMGKGGAALRQFGISFDESAALIGSLDKAGIQGDQVIQRLTRSLGEFAEAGKDPQDALFDTVNEIDRFMEAGDRAAAYDLAEGLFGTRGAASFIDAVQSGTLQVDDFMSGINASDDTILGLADETRTLGEQFDILKNQALVELEPYARAAFDALREGGVWVRDNVIPAIQDLVEWIRENKELVIGLTIVIGSMAAGLALARIGMVAYTVATRAMAVATLLSEKGIRGLNLAMKANIFGLIAGAIVGLIAALTWFFTQTETGKAIWESFTSAMGTAWEWVKGVLLSGWEMIKGAFAAAWAFISPIFEGLKIAFAVVVTAALLWWEGVKLYWGLVADLVVGAWNNVIKPVWDAMQFGLQALGAFFSWVWTALIQPAWNALGAGIQWVWATIINPTWELLKAALGAVGAAFWFYWNNVIKPAWDALGAGINWVWQNVISPAWDALKAALGAVGDFFNWVWNVVIKPAWDALGNGIRWVLDTVVHPAFEGLKTGLGFVRDAFQTAVDFIGQMWDRIKGITAAPIRFVIDTVYNSGIRAVWNKVAGWLGLDELDEMPMPEALGAYARGGVLPGHTPGRDIYNFVDPKTGVRVDLGGGEGIMTTEFVDAVGGPKAIDELNARARKGLPLGHAGHYAAGGVLPGWEKLTTDIQRAMAGSVANAFPNQVITSGTRYQDVGSGFDNHMAGRAVDFGPSGALASWIAREYPDTLELFWDPGPNMKNGAPTGAIGGHSDHVHWAMASMVDPYTGDVISHDGPGGGGGGVSAVRSLVANAFSSIMDPIMGMIPEGPGLFGGVAKGMATKLVDSVKEFLMGQSGGSSPHGDWVGTPGVEQFRSLVERLLAEKGHSQALVGSVLRRMNQESGGDPNAINLWDSNALAGWPTKGLMQMRDDTFLTNADPGYTNIWSPEDNLRSSLNYAMNEYGSISAAYDRAGGYDQGGWLPDDGIGINTSGMPEPVFSHDQWRDLKALIGAVIELTPAIEAWVDEGMVALEEFANGIIPAAQSEIGDGIAEFFGFGGLVTDVNSLMSEVQQAQAPTVGPVAVAEPPTAEAAEASEGAQGAVPLVHIENLHVEDEDAATAVGREVRRAVRSETLVGGW